jgi:hypothetical protein
VQKAIGFGGIRKIETSAAGIEYPTDFVTEIIGASVFA